MMRLRWIEREPLLLLLLLTFASIAFSFPIPVLAQESPFLTGATSLQANVLAWLTPIAIILVMIAGGLAMAGRASWAWFIGLLIGIPIAFGAPQIIAWIRGMFAV